MCGITTIFSYHKDGPPIDRAELLRMRERMTPRGPDGSGLWISDNQKVGFAHRRLSIIDLSESGAQPMASEDGAVVICFNGEIYNYRALRAELEKRGCHFRSSSDTEVIVHLYAQRGMEMVHDLRGMYAIALWDKREQSLYLARDPFGIKPLYIADDGKTIRAASQVKALLASGKVDTTPEPAGHVGFFIWGHVPEPFTLYKGIRSIEPGSWLKICKETSHQSLVTSYRFCSIADEIAKATNKSVQIDAEEAQKILSKGLRDTVHAHLIADVPVGVFLSSGLDSTTIAALASEVGTELRTVTLGFEEYRGIHDDEVPLAELVAKQYGAKHQTVWVTKDEFRSEYAKLLDAMDQPTLDGVNSYFVSLAAKKAGLKVVLSGLGGDELFGGYPSFQQIPRSVRTLGWANSLPLIGKGFRTCFAPLASRLTSPKYASLLEYGGSFSGAYFLRRSLMMPWELPEVLDRDMAQDGWGKLQTMVRLQESIADIENEHHKTSALESTWYMRNQLLRDTDWASMAHSLEVRVPMVDLQLLRTVAPLVESFGMSGKQAMAKTPAIALPSEVFHRNKTGFTVPVRKWLSGENNVTDRGLRGWAKDVYRNFSV